MIHIFGSEELVLDEHSWRNNLFREDIQCQANQALSVHFRK